MERKIFTPCKLEKILRTFTKKLQTKKFIIIIGVFIVFRKTKINYQINEKHIMKKMR